MGAPINKIPGKSSRARKLFRQQLSMASFHSQLNWRQLVTRLDRIVCLCCFFLMNFNFRFRVAVRLHFIFVAVYFLIPMSGKADSLDAGFQNPPDSARPQTWWHWMNGNVTKEGITADLEAMKRVGIGGAEIFNASEGIPPGPAKFLSPQWRDLMKFAASEADRLGLELCIHNCAGWSSSGGPWNTPENSMKHVVTSEIQVKGAAHFSGVVPQPRTALDFYRDIATFAFRTPDGEGVDFKSLAPRITSSAGEVDGEKLLDGRAGTFVTLPAPGTNKPQFIQLEFSKPLASRTIVLTPGTNMGYVRGTIQISDDGKIFRDVRSFAFVRRPTRPLGLSLGNESVSARFYRIQFTGAASGSKEIGLGDIELNPRLRIENVDAKDGDNGGFVMSSPSRDEVAPSLVINRNEMIDLTGKLGADGHLDWDAPAGDWTILRIGYTSTGRNNHPAPPEATGLECDKFSKSALDAHWNGFVQKVLDDLGPLAGKGKAFNDVLIDSYEVGGQNWSENFRAEFQKRRGYDPLPYLPTFTGRVVDSPEISERFLWDVRRTIADLFAENYYGHFQELCHEHGLKASIEPYTGPFESLQCGAAADIVMGEFWVGGNSIDKSVKLASSVGHIYGLPIIGAESFTAAPSAQHGRWLDDAYSIKARGDSVFCSGVNRYIFHRFAMQPWTNRWPGMTMGQWGTHFDRTSTWWEQSREWLRYVARCQFLLQRGRFVADAAYFCGESAPAELRVDQGEFALPPGYDYDGIDADVLLHHAKVENGKLVLDSGMTYRVLVLPSSDRNMTPELLRKLRDFVSDGLTLVGYAPTASPSLQNYPQCDAEIQKLVTEMWGEKNDAGEHMLGKGKVAWKKLVDVLNETSVKPDFEYTTKSGSQLVFIHRVDGDAEIYFVSNQREQFDAADCTFRVSGKTPELWHADTGVIERAPVWREENGRTIVPVQFDPAGSVFVVFRSGADGNHFVSVQAHQKLSGEKSKPAKLKIIKASYGYFPPANSTWTDVTAKVKALAAKGARQIPASNDFADEDPAPNVVKQLRVTFLVENSSHTMQAEEGESVTLPQSAVVTQALYGKLPAQTGRSETVDVTKKLAAQVRNGQLNVRADNALAGRDPAYLTPKELRVEYALDGAIKRAVVPENEILALPESSGAMGAPPNFEIAVDQNGLANVRAFAPGDFELRNASGHVLKASLSKLPRLREISGAWQLNFPPNWGAPERVSLDKLISWSDSPVVGVKYFSGTATYQKEIEIPAEMFGANREVWLDLGAVKNFAEVSLNGKSFPILWKPPFRLNVTDAVKAGKNKLEIKVTNLWPNRLIGDEQLPADREWIGKRLKEWPQWVLDGKPSPTGRFTFTTWHHWTKDEPLLESGLLGPVTLRAAERVTAK